MTSQKANNRHLSSENCMCTIFIKLLNLSQFHQDKTNGTCLTDRGDLTPRNVQGCPRKIIVSEVKKTLIAHRPFKRKSLQLSQVSMGERFDLVRERNDYELLKQVRVLKNSSNTTSQLKTEKIEPLGTLLCIAFLLTALF